jgi:L-fucose mutarotase/ribose pyranase (RbsD/FucU family)
MSFDGIDLNDTFYQALPEDKREAYKEAKLDEMEKEIDDTAAKAITDVENTEFYRNALDAPTQAATIEKTKYITIQQKLDVMKVGIIKQWGTKDSKALKEPRYPQNKTYRESYLNAINKQADDVKERITALDTIISTKTGTKQQRAELEKADKIKEITKLEDLQTLLKTEKKRIKKLLK